jgi:hypothetical protein
MDKMLTHYQQGTIVGDEIKLVTQGLATEEFGVYIKAINTLFINKLNSLVGFFKESNSYSTELAKAIEPNEIVKSLILKRKDMTFVINNAKMTKYEDIPMPVLQGLKLNLPTTLSILAGSMAIISSTLVSKLAITEKTISDIYSNKSMREIIKPLLEDTEYKKNISILLNNLNSMVDSQGVIDRKKLKDIIPNISSIETIYNDIIKLSEHVPASIFKDLDERVNRIADKTSDFAEYLASDKQDRITKEAINNLANYLEDTAKFVSYSISTFYVYHQVVNITNTIIDTLYEKESK